MIKKTVEYVDFEGDKQSETLWFHVSRSRVTDDIIWLTTEVKSIENIMSGEKRELTIPEVQRVLNFIKKMVELAYGERSEDGKRFRQTAETWQNFKDTAVYDQLIWDFMQNPNDGFAFIAAALPKDLVEQAQAQLPFGDGTQASIGQDAPRPIAPANPVENPKAMTREQLEAALEDLRQNGGVPAAQQ